MFKLLALLPLLAPTAGGVLFSSPKIHEGTYNEEHYEIVSGVLTSVKDEYLDATELRIYGSEFDDNAITSISDNAFDSMTNLQSIMISKEVTLTSADFLPNTVKNLYFTGKTEEFSLNNLSEEVVVHYEACDEGFISKWHAEIREYNDTTVSICDTVSKAQYNEFAELYSNLSYTGDFETVKLYPDTEEFNIGESMKKLADIYSPSSDSKNTEKTMTQSSMIVLILIIAAIGMTSIGLFYVLKDKKVIS